MMEAEESHPTVTTKKGATEDMAAKETAAPKRPSIQLEAGASTSDAADQHAEKRDAEEKSFGQLRTPKHANKTTGTGSRDESSPNSSGRGFSREVEQPNQKITPERKENTAATTAAYKGAMPWELHSNTQTIRHKRRCLMVITMVRLEKDTISFVLKPRRIQPSTIQEFA